MQVYVNGRSLSSSEETRNSPYEVKRQVLRSETLLRLFPPSIPNQVLKCREHIYWKKSAVNTAMKRSYAEMDEWKRQFVEWQERKSRAWAQHIQLKEKVQSRLKQLKDETLELEGINEHLQAIVSILDNRRSISNLVLASQNNGSQAESGERIMNSLTESHAQSDKSESLIIPKIEDSIDSATLTIVTPPQSRNPIRDKSPSPGPSGFNHSRDRRRLATYDSDSELNPKVLTSETIIRLSTRYTKTESRANKFRMLGNSLDRPRDSRSGKFLSKMRQAKIVLSSKNRWQISSSDDDSSDTLDNDAQDKKDRLWTPSNSNKPHRRRRKRRGRPRLDKSQPAKKK